jgi:hypothetical protein
MNNTKLQSDYDILQKKYQELYANNKAKQYFLDEAIEMMESIKNQMHNIVQSIKLHKFSIEDGNHRDDADAKLWEILDDETISNW